MASLASSPSESERVPSTSVSPLAEIPSASGNVDAIPLPPISDEIPNPLAIIVAADVGNLHPSPDEPNLPLQITLSPRIREDQAPPLLQLPAPESSPHAENSQIPSYAKAVRGSNDCRHLSHHDISVDDSSGEKISLIPDDIIENQAPLWDDFLVGQFPEKAPHIGKIHVIVNKIWTLSDKSLRIDAFVENDTTIKFRIRDKRTRERILRRGIWNIADKPMFMSKYGPEGSIEEQPELKSIPIWITLKNIPPNMFSWRGISFIASAAGTPKKLHPETEACKDFDVAKVYVIADLTKDLPTEVRFKSKSGIDSKIQYGYPWLPPRCTHCIKWGHLATNCRSHKSSPSTPRTMGEGEVLIQNEVSHKEETEKTSGSSGNQGNQGTINMETPSQTNLNLQNTSSGIVREVCVNEESKAKWTTITSPQKTLLLPQNSPEKNFNISPSRFAILSDEPASTFDTEVQGPEADDTSTKSAQDLPPTDSQLPESECGLTATNQNPDSLNITHPRETRARKANSKLKVQSAVGNTTAASNKKKNKKKH